ncbi:hypothetical protein DFH07DRAFT_788326 [Mycena maculata]|uniref:Alpha/beta-hydrolase n=1 Tax=Mycena maculata TaxID=230809 RepID=A0AAD7P0P4_9AGAR|nr:hypothetical protein DFH07DRAFT_788326 [Mycena maculata]
MEATEANYLPSFLAPYGSPSPINPLHAVFNHPLGAAHSLWWSSCDQSHKDPDAVFLFIPGNPGLLDFYVEFLSSLHNKHPGLAVFGHAHLSHTPGVHAEKFNPEYGLRAQIQSAVEALDAIRAAFGCTKIVLAGHSVGAWIALQVLKSRPSDVSHIFLLCPTLIHIADTPNGRRLSWLFRSPLPWVISQLSYLTRPLPLSLLFPDWSTPQRAVLRSLLSSPTNIFACLSMAHEEMITIRELDTALLTEHIHRIYLYFAEEDEWVSHHRSSIARIFVGDQAARVVGGQAGVPHAFCLNHGKEVASQCSAWLSLNL